MAVISYGFWQRRFGGAADVVGRSLTVERVPFTIVGVTPPTFFGADVGRTFDIAIPLGTEPLIRGKERALDRRSTWWLSVMVRLKAWPDARSGDGGAARHPAADSRGDDPRALPRRRTRRVPDRAVRARRRAATGSSVAARRYERPLTTIMVVVGAGAADRLREHREPAAGAGRRRGGTRSACGSRWARRGCGWSRQLLAESLLLSGLRRGARPALRALGQPAARPAARRPRPTPSSSTWRSTGACSASPPRSPSSRRCCSASRRRCARRACSRTKRSRNRGAASSASAASASATCSSSCRSRCRWCSSSRPACSSARSRRWRTLDLGFDREPVLVVSVNAQRLPLEPPSAAGALRAIRAGGRSRARRRACRGLRRSRRSAAAPGTACSSSPACPICRSASASSTSTCVSPGLVQALGTRLIAGRDFTDGDRAGAPTSRSSTRRSPEEASAAQNPVGTHLRVSRRSGRSRRQTYEIVGYVQDAVYRSLREPLPPTCILAAGAATASRRRRCQRERARGGRLAGAADRAAGGGARRRRSATSRSPSVRWRSR